MRIRFKILTCLPPRFLSCLSLFCALLFAGQVSAGAEDAAKTLQGLAEERQILMAELEQYKKAIATLQTDGKPAEESPDPAVRKLAVEAVALKKRLVAVTEQEVALRQQELSATSTNGNAPDNAATPSSGQQQAGSTNDAGQVLGNDGTESSAKDDAGNVARLHALLQSYYRELQESALILPTPEELSHREAAQRDAESLDNIPFSADKVRLSGSEGSTALADITKRLMDPDIPESRRDIAPIYLVKTRLFDTLVASESRSLRPVGKNHYIARIRLQPGDTTISILSSHWELQLPQHAESRDHLVTLYRPVDGAPELHVFAIDDLLSNDKHHIPAWLPVDLDVTSKAK